jgi:phage FluMu protein Com
VRCSCGNLLAYRTPRGVEIKCRRCKRVVQVLPLDELEAGKRGPPER